MQDIRELFIESIILKYSQINKRYFLQPNVSDYAYGGVLHQMDKNNEISIITYSSKICFKGAEWNYFSTEKEILAIVRCLVKFLIYILGQTLTIIIDNEALTFMSKCHLNTSRTPGGSYGCKNITLWFYTAVEETTLWPTYLVDILKLIQHVQNQHYKMEAEQGMWLWVKGYCEASICRLQNAKDY